MSTARRKLTNDEIKRAFESDTRVALTTKEAAELLGVNPKTLNSWRNAGYLEGTYRKRPGDDRYWRDRLIAHYFNGPEWHASK